MKPPYWRTLKANGELNAKYPGGVEAQKEKLEAEGHTIIQKGRTNIKYFVKDYESILFDLRWEVFILLNALSSYQPALNFQNWIPAATGDQRKQ